MRSLLFFVLLGSSAYGQVYDFTGFNWRDNQDIEAVIDFGAETVDIDLLPSSDPVVSFTFTSLGERFYCDAMTSGSQGGYISLIGETTDGFCNAWVHPGRSSGLLYFGTYDPPRFVAVFGDAAIAAAAAQSSVPEPASLAGVCLLVIPWIRRIWA